MKHVHTPAVPEVSTFTCDICGTRSGSDCPGDLDGWTTMTFSAKCDVGAVAVNGHACPACTPKIISLFPISPWKRAFQQNREQP